MGEKLFVDARLVVIAFQKSERGQLDQVAVPLLVPGEDGEMIKGVFLAALGGLVQARSRRQIHFTSNDRFHPHLARGLIEFDSPVEVSVIGEADGGFEGEKLGFGFEQEFLAGGVVGAWRWG